MANEVSYPGMKSTADRPKSETVEANPSGTKVPESEKTERSAS